MSNMTQKKAFVVITFKHKNIIGLFFEFVNFLGNAMHGFSDNGL